MRLVDLAPRRPDDEISGNPDIDAVAYGRELARLFDRAAASSWK